MKIKSSFGSLTGKSSNFDAEVICISDVKTIYHKNYNQNKKWIVRYKINEKYKCRIYDGIYFIYYNDINNIGFKGSDFNKNFMTLQEYRNKKLKKLL